MEAAAHWCRGGAPDTKAQTEALRVLGIDEETAKAMIPTEKPKPFAVWPENANAVQAFCAAGGQWLRDMMGRRYALRIEALPVVLEMIGVAPDQRAETMAGVQICERGALDYWARVS